MLQLQRETQEEPSGNCTLRTGEYNLTCVKQIVVSTTNVRVSSTCAPLKVVGFLFVSLQTHLARGHS